MTNRARSVGQLATPPVIAMPGRCSVGGAMVRSGSGAAASGASPFAGNDMHAYPFRLTARSTSIPKGFWVNGTSAGGNSSLAIYDADFVRLAQTASTAGTGNSVPQSVAWSGGTVKLGPGLYYAVLAHNGSTTNRFFRWSITNGSAFWKAVGCWKEGSITVGSLPATATPVAITSGAFPLFGLITRTVFDV